MGQREKLIELLVNPHKTDECLGGWCSNECKYFDSGDYCKTEMVADYLIANGVVVLTCRCGECAYAGEVPCRDIWCTKEQCYVKPDGYCHRAKRKGGDE